MLLDSTDHYAAVASASETLSAHLDDAVAASEREAGSGDTSLLLYLLIWCALTASALVLFARLSVTRVLAPAARIEAAPRCAATGAVDDPLTPPPLGWISRLAHEADRVRAGLSQSRWQARSGHQALAQNGPCATGLNRILTAQDGPGPGIDVHGALVPAEGLLAGDYLDSLALPDGSTAPVLGDVAGHGVPAGLLAVQLKCAVQSALRTGLGPVPAAHAAWRAPAHEDERFSTLLIAVADPDAATLTWLNAGQEQPFLVRPDGSVERLRPDRLRRRGHGQQEPAQGSCRRVPPVPRHEVGGGDGSRVRLVASGVEQSADGPGFRLDRPHARVDGPVGLEDHRLAPPGLLQRPGDLRVAVDAGLRGQPGELRRHRGAQPWRRGPLREGTEVELAYAGDRVPGLRHLVEDRQQQHAGQWRRGGVCRVPGDAVLRGQSCQQPRVGGRGAGPGIDADPLPLLSAGSERGPPVGTGHVVHTGRFDPLARLRPLRAVFHDGHAYLGPCFASRSTVVPRDSRASTSGGEIQGEVAAYRHRIPDACHWRVRRLSSPVAFVSRLHIHAAPASVTSTPSTVMPAVQPTPSKPATTSPASPSPPGFSPGAGASPASSGPDTALCAT
ncbi:SpoIIE family protein phosphatase [Streptomyces lavendulae]|uniref:SpoIIE family protein phosphatase n=1 Tax=Streptomyces lavendulae TaxID=1914 RepID=UPI00255512F1|nr:SpoIIE family protein phosphatase [Streptomyces lavendulae]